MQRVIFTSLLCFSLVPCGRTFHFCSNETYLSCSYQLWPNETEDVCQVKRYKIDQPNCQAVLPETPTRRTPQRGVIKIEPYKIITEKRTIFNITAHKITWNNLKIRFQQRNTEYCMKREFFITNLVPKDAILMYDCPWQTAAFEDTIIDFEYTYGVNNIYDGKRTFVIHVPKYESLDNFNASYLPDLILFTYVETTNTYQFIYKIHTAPSHLNITSYEIEVGFTKNNVTRIIDGPRVKDAESATLGVIDFEYDTFGIPGEYFFKVKPWNCPQCRYSVSAVVIIPESSTIVTFGIVGISCLIPIFLIILYMYFKADSGSRPRVLLITTPANNAHKTIGKSLAILLTQKYNIPTMFDNIDNPNNPNEWLKMSFKSATHVVILMSDHKPVTSIYRTIDSLLQPLIRADPDKICCSIKFPFTQEANLKFNVHRNFELMTDYTDFINYIHNRGLLHRLIYTVIRNDLYYDLVKQIDGYINNTVIIPAASLNIDNKECNHQNETNNSLEHEVVHADSMEDPDELPPDISYQIDKYLHDVSKAEPDLQSDTQSIDSTLQKLLEEVSCR